MQKDCFLDISKHKEFLDESIKIYMDSFEENQREDIKKIQKNINEGTYKMFSYLQNSEIVGFYILDINHKLNYLICTFLAVKESSRALGIGSKLCINAISYFRANTNCDWFLIEAEDKQAKLYEKFGFNIIDLDYQIPMFNSNKSLKTNLLVIQKGKKIDNASLVEIIKDIFHRGYGLSLNDNRLETQLTRLYGHF